MEVFKFGGASVKDAEGVINLVDILSIKNSQKTIIIISAMGKSTNALEKIIELYFAKENQVSLEILSLKEFHLKIIKNLFKEENNDCEKEVHKLFEELKLFLKSNKSPDYSFVYDQVVCFGELLSTTIIHYYMKYKKLDSFWLDARNCIKTDDYYRSANLNWELTQKSIIDQVENRSLVITQGFIGSSLNNFTTTLGREGSDYSAAIFAYALNAKSVTIWKDVPGVLNGDPRVFKKTRLLNQISYREAIELAFYGASVIHPKTLQPLQRKEIPLYVKSFENPKSKGT